MLWLTLVLLVWYWLSLALVHGNKGEYSGTSCSNLHKCVCHDIHHNSWYFPFGVNGMLAGSATVFFAYIGFDSVASTAEEALVSHCLFCCCLYMMVSVVIVGLVPYYAMDPDTPISSAECMQYLIAAGAVYGSLLKH
uniref:Amino acid transporter transmembrane domain-containing protein n=1 Tax=Salix viminalis TaxID=40686 RepID=A0A6N2N037_SALVM